MIGQEIPLDCRKLCGGGSAVENIRNIRCLCLNQMGDLVLSSKLMAFCSQTSKVYRRVNLQDSLKLGYIAEICLKTLKPFYLKSFCLKKILRISKIFNKNRAFFLKSVIRILGSFSKKDTNIRLNVFVKKCLRNITESFFCLR